jgi:hypothetical protein
MNIYKLALKEYYDVDRIHNNKNFGTNHPGHLKTADTILHVPTKPILTAIGEDSAWVVMQNGLSKPMEDFYGHGYKARVKAKHSVRIPYKMAVSMFGDLTVNSMPTEVK